jgi:hypothetical protein
MSYKTGWKYKNIGNDNKTNLFQYGSGNDKIVYDIYEKNKNFFPEIANQGKIESCVPTCISTLYYYYTVKQNNHLKIRISRLYLYYKVREVYSEIDKDNGSTIQDCINELVVNGAPPEFIYPYNIDNIFEPPCDLSINLSKYCKCLGFNKIDRFKIKKYLSNDDPIICGIKIFFDIHDKEIGKTGIIPSPITNSIIISGHCILIVGYNDNTQQYKFINSWGEKWGDNGCGYIGYDYIYNYRFSDEFYILKNVTNPKIKMLLNDTPAPAPAPNKSKENVNDGNSIMKSIQELFNLSINKK